MFKIKINIIVFKIEKLWDIETGEEIDFISPGVKNQKVMMKIPVSCDKDWILRRKKQENMMCFDKD